MMRELIRFMDLSFLNEARDNCNKKSDYLDRKLTELEFSKNLFRIPLDKKNYKSISAHLQSLHKWLNDILDEEKNKNYKTDQLYIEFKKNISIFDNYTNVLGMTGYIQADNFITGNSFYRDAVASYMKPIPQFYIGDYDIACIPIKLRMAIECYIKNMIGFISAKQIILNGKKKGKESDYVISISKLLQFFQDDEYKKYANLPVNPSILQDINYWANSFMHTGVTLFPWQSLSAIELLEPMFKHWNESKKFSLHGFNSLNMEHSFNDLVKDLNTFLSSDHKKVEITLLPRSKYPTEGVYG
ncbi:hypothetical protein [Serratia fonticola]